MTFHSNDKKYIILVIFKALKFSKQVPNIGQPLLRQHIQCMELSDKLDSSTYIMIMDYLYDTDKMIILRKFLNIVKYQGKSIINYEDDGTL